MARATDSTTVRWLGSLGYPFLDTFSATAPVELQQAVCWLEDVVIRALPIPDRAVLRTTSFSSEFGKYLEHLNAPRGIAPSSADEAARVKELAHAVRWLARLGLQHAYDDAETIYNEPIDPWDGRCVPVTTGVSTNEAVDCKVRTTLQRLQLDRVAPQDSEIALRAVATLVEGATTRARMQAQLKQNSSEAFAATAPSAEPNSEAKISLESLPIGFSTGDKAVDACARVLRLLYVRKLRGLEDHVARAIATMQAYTANPKTDSRLGQVGR